MTLTVIQKIIFKNSLIRPAALSSEPKRILHRDASLYFNDIKRTKKWIWEGGKTPPRWSDVEPVLENQRRINEFNE